MSSVLELGCIRMRDVDCILCCVTSQRLSFPVLSLRLKLFVEIEIERESLGITVY